jgi:ADP-heptose:LPS heptosyltransferase
VSAKPNILVIKLSALGDFVQALGPFAAIRAHHRDARIFLLTTRPYAEFARKSPYFDDIWIDNRPKPWDVPGILSLRKRLRGVKFSMVYDLQTSERSNSYFQLMGDPPWSGIAPGCSHPHANPERDRMHTVERQAEQLAMAGVPMVDADLSWVDGDVDDLGLSERFLLLVPGGARHRPEKRWPAERYAALAERVATHRISSVVVGTGPDAEAIDAVVGAARHAMSLADQTTLADLVAIARRAVAAVGNDTGPMHLIAAAGCPSVVLFSAESDPSLCAPRGTVEILRRDDLTTLDVETVLTVLKGFGGRTPPR